MRKEEYDKLLDIATDKPWLASKLLKDYLQTADIHEEPKGARTGAQNAALHVGFKLLADALNDAGLDIRAVLKPEVSIDWNPFTVKEYLFKPVMRVMYGKDSTRELSKVGEIEKVWDTVLRHLGEKHGLEYIEFPHADGVRMTALNNLKNEQYPEYQGPASF